VQFFGENEPKRINGLSIVAVPAQDEFDRPGSGDWEAKNSAGSSSGGRSRPKGYAAQKLLEVKNP
jgi:hypothetical protein